MIISVTRNGVTEITVTEITTTYVSRYYALESPIYQPFMIARKRYTTANHTHVRLKAWNIIHMQIQW